MATVIHTKNNLEDAKKAARAKAAKERHAFMNPKTKVKKGSGNYVKSKDLTPKPKAKPKAKPKRRNPYSPVSQPKEHAAWRVKHSGA